MKDIKLYKEIDKEDLENVGGGTNIIKDTIDYVVGFVVSLIK